MTTSPARPNSNSGNGFGKLGPPPPYLIRIGRGSIADPAPNYDTGKTAFRRGMIQGPEISTTEPSPAFARAQRRFRSSISSSRPTIGVPEKANAK